MMKTKNNYAIKSPKKLALNPIYWLANIKLLCIISAFIILLFVLSDFTFPREENIFRYASLPIIFLGFYGIIITLSVIAKLDVENSIAKYVDYKAIDLLESVTVGNELIDINDIENRIIPNNPDQDLSILELFRNIIKEAKDRKFESTMLLMHPYKEEASDQIFKLQSLLKIALHLGILGTFIGLILALARLDFSDTSNLEVFVFEPLFNALNISFSTSVAGLEVAVILGLIIMSVKRKQEIYFRNMKSATITVVSLARNSLIDDKLFNEFDQIKSSMRNLDDRIYNQSELLKEQIITINKGISKLDKTKIEYNEFLMSIDKSQSIFIKKLQDTYNEFIPENIGKQLEDKLKIVVDKISNTLNEQLGQTNVSINSFNDGVNTMNSTLQDIKTEFKESLNALIEEDFKSEETRQKFYRSVTEINNSFFKKLDKQLEHVVSNFRRDLKLFFKEYDSPIVERHSIEYPKRKKKIRFFNIFRR